VVQDRVTGTAYVGVSVSDEYGQYEDMLLTAPPEVNVSIVDTYEEYLDSLSAKVHYKLSDLAMDQTPVIGADAIIGAFLIGGAVLETIGEFTIGSGHIGPVYGISVDDSGVRRYVDLDGPGGLPPSELTPGGYNL
jgi:hypothetical protein